MEEHCEHDSKLQQLLMLKAKKIVDLGGIKPWVFQSCGDCAKEGWLWTSWCQESQCCCQFWCIAHAVNGLHGGACWKCQQHHHVGPLQWLLADSFGGAIKPIHCIFHTIRTHTHTQQGHLDSMEHLQHYKGCWMFLRGFKSFGATYPDDMAIFSHSREHHFITYNRSCCASSEHLWPSMLKNVSGPRVKFTTSAFSWEGDTFTRSWKNYYFFPICYNEVLIKFENDHELTRILQNIFELFSLLLTTVIISWFWAVGKDPSVVSGCHL